MLITACLNRAASINTPEKAFSYIEMCNRRPRDFRAFPDSVGGMELISLDFSVFFRYKIFP